MASSEQPACRFVAVSGKPKASRTLRTRPLWLGSREAYRGTEASIEGGREGGEEMDASPAGLRKWWRCDAVDFSKGLEGENAVNAGLSGWRQCATFRLWSIVVTSPSSFGANIQPSFDCKINHYFHTVGFFPT